MTPARSLILGLFVLASSFGSAQAAATENAYTPLCTTKEADGYHALFVGEKRATPYFSIRELDKLVDTRDRLVAEQACEFNAATLPKCSLASGPQGHAVLFDGDQATHSTDDPKLAAGTMQLLITKQLCRE